MTAEDKQLLDETHLYVKALLNEAHISGSPELSDAIRSNADTSKDIEAMIDVLRVHKKYKEGNPGSAPIGMLGMQRPVASAEADSIGERIQALTQLKARMRN